jgi:hypothetical protein
MATKAKDITHKVLLDYADVFADVVNVALFDGRPVVKEDTLRESGVITQIKLEDGVHEQERDIAKIWETGKRKVALIGIENQNDPSRLMPLRVIGYDGASYKEQVSRRLSPKDGETPQPLYPVLTFVLNYGTGKWTAPTSVLESIGRENIPPEILPYLNDYRITVLDIGQMKKEDLEKFQSDYRHIAKLVWARANHASYEPDDTPIVHADETIKAASAVTGDSSYTDAYNELLKSKKEGNVTMCRIVEEFVEKGKVEGRAEGRAEGQESVFSVFNAFQNTGSVEQTVRETGMEESKVISILQRLGQLPS